MWIPPRSESMKPKYSRRLANALTNCSPPTTPTTTTTTTTTLTVLRPDGFAAGKKGAHLKEKREKEAPPTAPSGKKNRKKGGGRRNETGKGKKRKVPICRIGPSICFPFFPSLSFYLFSSLTADFFLLAWVDLFFSIMQKNIGALFSPFLSVVAAAVVSGAFTVCIPPTTFPQPPSPSHESAINHIQECRGEEESNHDAISREREAGLCVVQCGWGGGN